MAQTVHKQETKHSSPWTLRQRIKMQIWGVSWAVLCGWTPKPLYRWRTLVLRLFGAKIHGVPFVHQKAKVQVPWNVELFDRCAIGDGAVLYSLGRIVVRENAVIAQEAYICTGTHDFTQPHEPLVTSPIEIDKGAFVGARAFVMPGVRIGRGSVVGAMSVVTKNVPGETIWAGNPAKQIAERVIAN